MDNLIIEAFKKDWKIKNIKKVKKVYKSYSTLYNILISFIIVILLNTFLFCILSLSEGRYVEFSYVYISVCLVGSFIFGAIKLYKENFK